MLVSDEIIKILDALAERFGIAIDWTSQNVVPYIEQLYHKFINYEIVTSVVWILLACVFMFLAYRVYKPIYQYEVKDTGDGFYSKLVFYIVLSLPILVICIQIFDIVTCLTFPEKIIFEEIKSIYTSINQTK